MVNLYINENKCIGCGLCATIAPKTFKLGKKNKAEVIDPKGDKETKIKEAIRSCPVQAIYKK